MALSIARLTYKNNQIKDTQNDDTQNNDPQQNNKNATLIT